MFFIGQEISSAKYILYEDDDENDETSLDGEIKSIEIKFTNCDKYINITAETTSHCSTLSWLECYNEKNNTCINDFIGKKISSIEYVDDKIELYDENTIYNTIYIYSIQINFEDKTNFKFLLCSMSNGYYDCWIDIKFFNENEDPINVDINYEDRTKPSFSIEYDNDKNQLSGKDEQDENFTIEDLSISHKKVCNIYPPKKK
jgi:hypothetical protein